MRALRTAEYGLKSGKGIVHSVMSTEPENDELREACYLSIIRQRYPNFDGDRDEAAGRINNMVFEHGTDTMLGFVTKAVLTADFCVGTRVKVISHHPRMGDCGIVIRVLADDREVKFDRWDGTMWCHVSELGDEHHDLSWFSLGSLVDR